MRTLALVALLFLTALVPVGGAGTITDTPPYRAYAEDFDALPLGSTPVDSWYSATTSGTGTQLVQTAPPGMTGRAWKIADTGSPYAAMMDNTGGNVQLCTPQAIGFSGVVVDDLAIGTTWEFRVQTGGVSTTSAPANSLGVRFSGAVGANTVNYFIHGNALASVTGTTGTLVNGNVFTLLISQVNCAGTASARFTQTGIAGIAATVDMVATAGDPFGGDMDGFVIANTAGAAATSVWFDSYNWDGAPIPADETGPDADGDGKADDFDNCPGTSNTNQADYDGDGVGNVCEVLTDTTDCDNGPYLETFESFAAGYPTPETKPTKCWYVFTETGGGGASFQNAHICSPTNSPAPLTRFGSKGFQPQAPRDGNSNCIAGASEPSAPNSQTDRFTFNNVPDLCVEKANAVVTLSFDVQNVMNTVSGGNAHFNGIETARIGMTFQLQGNTAPFSVNGVNLVPTLAGSAVEGRWFHARQVIDCWDENTQSARFLLTTTMTDWETGETASLITTVAGPRNVPSFILQGQGGAGVYSAIDNLRLDAIIPPQAEALATVALAGVTGMDIRTIAGLGNVVVRYDGGDLINAFNPMSLQANSATPADTNCLISYGVVSRGPDEADPEGDHLAFTQCATGADNNNVIEIHIRSSHMTVPDKGTCDWCHQDIKENEFADDIDDIQPTMAEISDLGAFPITYRGYPEGDRVVIAFPFTRFGNGGFGGYFVTQVDDFPDRDGVKLKDYGPASTTIDDMCRTWYGTVDFFGVAHQDVGFQMWSQKFIDDGGLVTTLNAESSIAPAPFSAPYSASCDGQWAHLGGVQPGVGGVVGVWDWRCSAGGSNPTCPAPGGSPSSVLWQKTGVSPTNRGLVFQATGTGPESARVGSGSVFHYGAYIDGVEVVVWQGFGEETCRFNAPFTLQSNFREIRMDENAQNLWIAWSGGVSRYDVVPCTTISPVSEEGRIDASHADADPCPPDRSDEWYCGDSLEDNNEPVPENPDCNGDGIQDGNQTTNCRPEDCTFAGANGQCAPLECTPEDQSGCEIDQPGNQDDAARESEASDFSVDASIGGGLFFRLTGTSVSEAACVVWGLVWVALWIGLSIFVTKKGGGKSAPYIVIFGAVSAFILFCFYLWIIIITALIAGAIIIRDRGV